RPYQTRHPRGGRSASVPSLRGQTRGPEPPRQELRREPLQAARQQRKAVRDEQQAEEDHQDTGEAIDPDDVGPEPLEPDEEAIERERRDDEGDGEPEGVDGEECHSLAYRRLGGGEREDRAQDRADARSPGSAERDAH